MRRLLVVAASVPMLLAAGAFAGEVKGPPQDPNGNTTHNTNDTAAPTHANSVCAFSGLNDFDPDEGQRVSQVQTAADSFKIYTALGLPPGVVGRPEYADGPFTCRGGSNPEKE
jgi:hypothetical protein